MDSKNNFKVIGLMSGTSLDGLDIACCTFKRSAEGWKYNLQKTATIRYSPTWTRKLSTAHQLSGEQLMALDSEYGKYLGNVSADFIRQHKLRGIDFIASHGHTVFHQPEKGFTCQLGNGNALHAVAKLPVVSDFRTLDVMLGGQGAPLVPAGDQWLFGEYDVCLNLGGIANLSATTSRQRIAFDICFANMGLNYLAAKAGKTFDAGGNLASEGELRPSMLKALSGVYAKLRSKRPSLGREIFEQRIKPILEEDSSSISDRLRTFTESIAIEIAQAVLQDKKKVTVLCTGGGAVNSFLITRLLDHCGDRAELILPEDDIIKFKEALVFAFLGVLRVCGEPNCLKSVTGAIHDNAGGVLAGFNVFPLLR
jgi:anhydro-N-acetylmuramic acid kinase